MAEQTIPSDDPTKRYVYQDGTHHRTNLRSPPQWNRSVAIGVLCSALLLIVLIVIGMFFFNDSVVKQVIFNQNTLAPVCKADPGIGYKNFCAEDTLISPDHKYIFHAGRLSFSRAQRACAALPGGGGNLTTIQSEQQEKRFDSRIENLRPILFANDETVFTGFRKQIWTGGYIDLELDGIRRMRWIDDAGLSERRQNFCQPKQAMEILKFSLDEFTRYGAITNPLVYIVKDYRATNKGCWQLYSPFVYETEHLEFSFVCQVAKAGLPFVFHRNFLGDFRPTDVKNELLANEYAVFSGRGTYSIARETCQYLASGVQMIAPKTSALDAEINKGVEIHSDEIFGEDNGDPQRRKLIWTGGYFNLSSKNPTKIRRADDPDTLVDTAEPASIIGSYFGSGSNKTKDYENFCGTVEYYQGLIKKALNEERYVEDAGCIRERLFLITKDFREDQSIQGCWQVYDSDYLSRNNYKLFLVCKRPYPVLKKEGS